MSNRNQGQIWMVKRQRLLSAKQEIFCSDFQNEALPLFLFRVISPSFAAIIVSVVVSSELLQVSTDHISFTNFELNLLFHLHG